MKKRIIGIALALMCMLVLAGCGCDHEWEDADCTTPKTCSECGKTKGEALGHDWEDGDCSSPRICKDCGETEGKTQGHNWKDATCASPKTCTECGKTRGEPLEHDWKEATCTKPKTCRNCGETQGEPLGHNWSPSSCTDPGVCMTCGETGKTMDHNWKEATCSAPKTCRNCGETEGDVLDHDWSYDAATNTKYCSMCGLEGESSSNNSNSGSSIPEVSIGDTLTMGYYGYDEIEWIVLDYDPATNQALLISRYCLDAIPYHAGSSYGSWENSTLRRWLNQAFISTAFTQEERDMIVTTHLSNPDNPDFGVDGGNDTNDRIFILSYEEAVYYFPTIKSRRGQPTDYCLEQGCYDPVKYAEEIGKECDPESVGYTWWWLRTPGIDAEHACNVLEGGTASSYGGYQTSSQGTIRPAMWIQLG